MADKNESKPFKQILIETDTGKVVPLRELPKEQYEYFLTLTHNLRLAYIALTQPQEDQ